MKSAQSEVCWPRAWCEKLLCPEHLFQERHGGQGSGEGSIFWIITCFHPHNLEHPSFCRPSQGGMKPAPNGPKHLVNHLRVYPFPKYSASCVINSSNKPLLCTYYVSGPKLVLLLQPSRIGRQMNRQMWYSLGNAMLGEHQGERSDLVWKSGWVSWRKGRLENSTCKGLDTREERAYGGGKHSADCG